MPVCTPNDFNTSIKYICNTELHAWDEELTTVANNANNGSKFRLNVIFTSTFLWFKMTILPPDIRVT